MGRENEPPAPGGLGQGSLRARVDAIASQPLRRSLHAAHELPPSASARPSARPSQVRAVLSQAALHMHLPDANATAARTAAGPEYDRLRSTLKQLKQDAQGNLGAVGAQLAMETEASRVIDHVNAQMRAIQRAFGVLADTLEDEVGNLRAADAQQWEQLKVHATQFNEIEELKAELERTRGEMRSMQNAFTAFKNDPHVVLARKVDELAAELADQREANAAFHKSITAERSGLADEVSVLKRWRADVAAPVLEKTGVKLSNHDQLLQHALPTVQKLAEDVDARVSKHLPELLHAVDAAAQRMQAVEEEGSRSAAQLRGLGEAHSQATARLDERLRLFRDESRTEAESHELRLRQAAAELEAHADALRELNGEGQKARQEAREEADTIAAAVRAGQATAAEASETSERHMAAARADLTELKEQCNQASAREAQTLEAVLNLRTSQNQVSAWMDHVQRELTTSKAATDKNAEVMRELALEVDTVKKARAAGREELALVDAKLADAMLAISSQQAERQHVLQLGGALDALKREMRTAFEASQHAHNRLRELVEDQRAASAASAAVQSGGGGGGGGGYSGGGGGGGYSVSAGYGASGRPQPAPFGVEPGQLATHERPWAPSVPAAPPVVPPSTRTPGFRWEADVADGPRSASANAPAAGGTPLLYGSTQPVTTPARSFRVGAFESVSPTTARLSLPLNSTINPAASPAVSRRGEPRRHSPGSS